MEQLIPRTLKRWESYQSNLYKSAVLAKFQGMTRGHLTLSCQNDSMTYSFGYGQKISASMDVRNERFFTRFLRQGELGFGESYVDGDWDAPDLVQVIRWFFLNMDHLESLARIDLDDQPLFQFLQGLQRVQNVINRSVPHGFTNALAGTYVLERPFFALMLDSSLTNSGAIFAEGETLEEAQLRKQRRIAQELQIQAGDHILELGSGWGSLAFYLALCFPCKVTTLTISEEQHRFICERVRELRLENRVYPLLLDYKSMNGKFDRIVSVEMVDLLPSCELPHFFARCDALLKPQGIAVLQLLLSPERFRADSHPGSQWIHKYISPGTATPTLQQLVEAMNETFSLRRFEDLGLSYAKTLEAWRERFESKLAEVKNLGFDETFIRSWRYYLAYAQAAFGYGLLTAAQITLTRPTQRALEGQTASSQDKVNLSMLME